MNYLRTTLLLAALTALSAGIEYLFGGASGALLALLLAAAARVNSQPSNETYYFPAEWRRRHQPHKERMPMSALSRRIL
jgi:hypothetical protein